MTSYVLVVDDHDDRRTAVRAMLDVADYKVLEAADARQALDFLLEPARVLPAIILLSFEMRGMTGLELATILKSYYRLSRIPIVFTSSEPAPPEIPVKRLAVDFVTRPITRDALLDLVGRHMSAPESD